MKIILIIHIILFLNSFLFCSSAVYQMIDENQENNNFEVAFELSLEFYKNNKNDSEILWRLARSYFDLSDQTSDEKLQKKYIDQGLPFAKKALELNPDSAKSNHWYAVMFGRQGQLEGTKQKILNSYDMKEYCLRAIGIDPNYDGSLHVMGRWHYNIANLSWFERNIARIVYATPPTGSFKEAIEYFEKAITVNPKDIRHYLWLGKSLYAINDYAKAKEILTKSLALELNTDSDKLLKEQVIDLLEKM
tara:strand:+ start:1191 stop:1934 length:744 start_codon:yes stop_codon:yes gene_type:complete